jgi:hypothetical protein
MEEKATREKEQYPKSAGTGGHLEMAELTMCYLQHDKVEGNTYTNNFMNHKKINTQQQNRSHSVNTH